MVLDPGGQHTLGHLDCPACERQRQALLCGGSIAATDTFSRAAELWLESRTLTGNLDRAQFVSDRTVRDNQQYIKALARFFGALPLGQVHAGHLRQYQLERAAGVGNAKINQELGLLVRILRRAGLWTAELEECYQPLKTFQPEVAQALDPDEQQRLLTVAASRKNWQTVYWYLIVALHTTCSTAEMRAIRLGDVDLYDEVLLVQPARAKNVHRPRTIPLSRDALWALERLYQRARSLGAMRPTDYLFPLQVGRDRYDPHHSMTASGIKKPFQQIRAAAGFPSLRPHDLRHTAITRLAEEGVPVETIMEIAGHISPRMTRHYTHISKQAKSRAVVAAFDSHPVRMSPKAVEKGTAKANSG
jgi:integrase